MSEKKNLKIASIRAPELICSIYHFIQIKEDEIHIILISMEGTYQIIQIKKDGNTQ